MKPVRVVLASGNPGKLAELSALLDEPSIRLVSMAQVLSTEFDVEETGATFEENAWLKAEAVCQATGLPALADDSGLAVDALGGQPGVFSARYAGVHGDDAANNARLLRELAQLPQKERSARFVCVLAFAIPGPRGEPHRQASARGEVFGSILEFPRGTGGFGYDPLFEAQDFPGRSTAEISSGEKNSISHRGKAARALRLQLGKWLATVAADD